jgi:hypothetical protein
VAVRPVFIKILIGALAVSLLGNLVLALMNLR